MAKRFKKKTEPQETDRAAPLQRGVPSPTTNWKFFLSKVLVIVAAGSWVFWPALHGDWLWDDRFYVTDNPLLHDPARLWKAWFEPGSFVEYYPLEETAQWIQWQLWHEETFGYHLTNVVLHIVNALLLWRLFTKFGLKLAWLGGLIFAIHPAVVESVAWITEIKNTLSLTPFLLAMGFLIDYENHQRPRDYLWALGLFLVAMLCKISMAPFPVTLLLYAWWKRGRIGWSDLKASLPFFIISLVLSLTTIFAGIWFRQSHAIPADLVPIGGFFSRLALAGLAIMFYFSDCFWPVGLLPIYQKWPIDPSSPLQFLPWAIFAGVGCWLWRKRQDWGRHALLGLGFFLIYLAPFVGFIATSYMDFTWVMDHFLYIPLIGLIGLTVAGLEQIQRQLPLAVHPYGIGIVTMALAFLAWQSHGYTQIFQSDETLWSQVIRHNPGSYYAHNNLGAALTNTGRLPDAIEQFQEALKIKPDSAEARNNWGNALVQTGQPEKAMDQFREALRIKPNLIEARNNLGNTFRQLGRLQEAVDQYQEAIRINPDYSDSRNGLGATLIQLDRIPEGIDQYRQALRIQPDNADIHYNLGTALEQAGQLQEAIEQYKEALKINPDDIEAHLKLGTDLYRTNQIPQAIEQDEQALKIRPDLAEAHYNLGNIFIRANRFSEAIEHYQQALKIHPDLAEARYNLGNALIQTNRLPEAIEQFKQVLKLNPNSADAHGNLGIALMQSDRIPEAIEQFELSLKINPNDADVRNQLTQLQNLHRATPATGPSVK